MRPTGSAGETQTWRSKVTFPRDASGTVRWQVKVFGKRSDGEPVERRYDGKEFRL